MLFIIFQQLTEPEQKPKLKKKQHQKTQNPKNALDETVGGAHAATVGATLKC